MLDFDFHMHSAHSADSEEEMERMIDGAIEKGMKTICFTEHQDLDFPKEKEEFDYLLDTELYLSHFQACKKKYEGRIELRFGVEFGLQPHLTRRCHEYISAYSFDFVIGSSHIVNGKDPYLSEYFEGRSEREAFTEYFEAVLSCASLFDDFDVYGHLDYVVRYSPNKDRNYSCAAYSDILDEILKTLVQKGKGLEINTGGLAHGLLQPNPAVEVLKRYRELGGEILTVGSDAHRAERIGYRFDTALLTVREAGFRYLTVFKDRRPSFVPINFL
ncbi:MAG: histidinol-phosphatase HisJ family protein [Lachnospiraceae bacterium]|nr:histidinol-phosphatase HisJ family protein [Lachnospiraceae bacterium]